MDEQLKHIQAVKDTLLANLDAQLQHLRFRFGCNMVLMSEGIESELSSVKNCLEQITALHKVAQAIRVLHRHGVNKPL